MRALMRQASLWRCLPTLCRLNISPGFSFRMNWMPCKLKLPCVVQICWIMPPTVSTAASGAEAASMPSSPSGAASESLPRSWSACHGGSSSGNKPHRLKPVAELLPFDGDLLDEESALREAGAFPEDYAPDHAAHAAPALWWPHSAAQRSAPSALLVPELPTHHADSGQVLSGRPWGSHMVSLANLSLSRFQRTISH